METDEDVGRGLKRDSQGSWDATLEGDMGAGANDLGDMTFCMANYIANAMKVKKMLHYTRFLLDSAMKDS